MHPEKKGRGRFKTCFPLPPLMMNSHLLMILSFLPPLIRPIKAMFTMIISVGRLTTTVGVMLMRIFISGRKKLVADFTCHTRTLTRSRGHRNTTMGDVNIRKSQAKLKMNYQFLIMGKWEKESGKREKPEILTKRENESEKQTSLLHSDQD